MSYIGLAAKDIKAIRYSTEAEIDDLVQQINKTSNGIPNINIADIDGCSGVAWILTDDGKKFLETYLNEHPKIKIGEMRSFPAEWDSKMCQAFHEQGYLTPSIFAPQAHKLDVRLPAQLVELLEKTIPAGDPFALGFLTSRKTSEAESIVHDSIGHHNPVVKLRDVTLVSNAGNNVQCMGKVRQIRPLETHERKFLWDNGLVKLHADMDNQAMQVLAEHGIKLEDLHAAEQKLDSALTTEDKDTAGNIHWGDICDQVPKILTKLETAKVIAEKGETHMLSEKELKGIEALVDEKAKKIETAFEHIVTSGIDTYLQSPDMPKVNDAPLFKLVPGNRTCEIAYNINIDKGRGLREVLKIAKESDRPIGNVLAYGDDSKMEGTPEAPKYGTDRAMMVETQKFGDNGYNMQLVHPEKRDMNSRVPDKVYVPAPDLDIAAIFAHPLELAAFMNKLMQHQKHEEKQSDFERKPDKRINHPEQARIVLERMRPGTYRPGAGSVRN